MCGRDCNVRGVVRSHDHCKRRGIIAVQAKDATTSAALEYGVT